MIENEEIVNEELEKSEDAATEQEIQHDASVEESEETPVAEADETPVAKEEVVEEEVVEETTPKVEEEFVKPVNIYSLENFDWDAIGKKHENYSVDERTKLEGIYDETLSSIGEHEVIDGTVVAKNSREVVVNIGFKSDGVIPLSELRYNPNLKVGDTIEVYVESQEDMGGQLILSHKKARILRSWERVNEAHDKGEVINGYVKCRTKGGLIVDVFGIEAFLP
jgi:small subunit ribosomal protein S1